MGIYSGHPKGFGFLRPAGQDPRRRSLRSQDLFVPVGAAGGAIDGDRVRARVGPGGTARVVEVLERGRRQIAGTYLEGERFRPDAHSIPHPLPLSSVPAGGGAVGGGRPARPGDKVLAAASPDGFVLVQVLGKAGDPAVEDRAVLLEMEIPEAFPPAVLEEAERFHGARIGPRERRGRIDLRGEPTVVTIDPLTARDFDDAISLRRSGSGYLLGVHIADVGHCVEEGSAMDREARVRGASAYLPMKVVPMLPPVLGDGLCSLREGEDRLAMTVLLDFDRAGGLRGARVGRTVIRSDRRFTYERASRVMEGAGGETPEVSRLLRDMHELARKLRERRPSLAIHEPGVQFVYSPAGDVVEVQTTEGDDAHWVVEECMLVANREVAGWLLRKGQPALFRHHPPPTNLEELREFLEVMGVPGAKVKPLPELMRRAEEAGLGAAATSFLMEAMEPAVYSSREPRHDALGFAHYTHFTSPIRRYADLMVHRAVGRLLPRGRWGEMGPPRRSTAAGRSTPAGRSSGAAAPPSTAELEDLAEHLNRRERSIDAAERRLRRRRVLEYLTRKGKEPLQGVVLRTLDRGLLVNLPGYLLSGFLAISHLGGGARRAERHTLVTGTRTYRPGQPIEVMVERVDPGRGELDLMPADR